MNQNLFISYDSAENSLTKLLQLYDDFIIIFVSFPDWIRLIGCEKKKVICTVYTIDHNF